MGRTRPFNPAAAERQRQSRLSREGEARAKTRADDARPETWGLVPDALALTANAAVEAARDGRGRVVAAYRADVFDLLHGRGGLSVAELAAARRLETDMAQRVGLFRPDHLYVLVDAQTKVDGASQRMLEAGARVEQALCAVGPRQALLLRSLVEPAILHGRVVDWRAVVMRETGETNPHVQPAMVRSACDNLALAYQAIDNPPRRRG